MRIWIEFEKNAPLRYLSHLDLMRVWQRAIRRAALPLVYSQGFNPHPKISFASALPVGVVSHAEYIDINFARIVTGEEVDQLQAVLPAGLMIIHWRPVPDSAPALMSLVRAALWSVPVCEDSAAVEERMKKLLASSELPVLRVTKKGERIVDIRPYIYRIHVNKEEKRLEMLLASGGDGGAKPREILELLQIQDCAAGLLREQLLIEADAYVQSPMDVLLKGKEVSVNAEKDCYQLRQ